MHQQAEIEHSEPYILKKGHMFSPFSKPVFFVKGLVLLFSVFYTPFLYFYLSGVIGWINEVQKEKGQGAKK